MAGKRADAAQSGLLEQRVVGKAQVFEKASQCARAAPETQAVDGEHGDFGVDVEARSPRRGMAARHGFAHDHPQRVKRRNVVAAGQQQLVAERVLGPPVVVAQAAVLRPGQVQSDVVGRIGQRAAEVAGLLVVAQQRQRHGGEEAHVLEALAVVVRDFDAGGAFVGAGAGGSNKD